MTILFYIFLLLGIVVLIFGILTFLGKTSVSKRKFYLSGVELDPAAIGIAIFFIGMLLIAVFLIAVMGPHFTEEGL